MLVALMSLFIKFLYGRGGQGCSWIKDANAPMSSSQPPWVGGFRRKCAHYGWLHRPIFNACIATEGACRVTVSSG